ncbi:hypothetical protein BXY66_1303 [Shimia isoporae]|uniref:Uncharacterized protein n=1 Tax=Shimia isoporae TaxID=647720 RepID=A0A4R1NVF7_9RHOB|nr:hypothetical protein BXY66_1303 [Shimia isoporae]
MVDARGATGLGEGFGIATGFGVGRDMLRAPDFVMNDGILIFFPAIASDNLYNCRKIASVSKNDRDAEAA